MKRYVACFFAYFTVACCVALCSATPALAGGPYSCANAPLKYAGAGTITLNYDQGTLGGRSKAQADALVTQAVSIWAAVPTATVSLLRGNDLPVDVTLANYASYSQNYTDGLNPVVYDSDGSIIDSLFGVGAKSHLLGFAGSHYVGCQFTEGLAVINGWVSVTDTTLKVVMAHEVGHMIGLDHAQIDSHQGLTTSNYPLMYPVAYRNQLSLHEDEISAISTLYPDPTLTQTYGQLSGAFTQVVGAGILGANLWVTEKKSKKVFSVVSDYLKQNTGYFELMLPSGTYTLHAEAIQKAYAGASSVGPYARTATAPSFLSPLYVNGTAMTPLTLGNATPIQIAISPGCTATASFRFDGTGSVSGNCHHSGSDIMPILLLLLD